jgi:hypothetical protein
LLSGVVVSGLVVVAGSLLTDVPGAAPPEAAALDVPPGSEFDREKEDRQAELPQVEESPAPAEAPRVAAPERDDLASLEGSDTSPARQPETGQAEGALPAPREGKEAADVMVEPETPVTPGTQAPAPTAPGAERKPVVPDAAVPAPEAGAAQGDLAPPDADTGSADVAVSEDTPVTSDRQAAAPAAPEAETGIDVETDPVEVPQTGGAQDPMQAPRADAPAADVAGTGPAPAGSDPSQAPQAPRPEDDIASVPDPVRAPRADAPDTGGAASGEAGISADPAQPRAPDVGETSAFPDPEAPEPAEEEPSGTIGDLAENVTTERLPAIGTDEPSDQAEGDAAADPDPSRGALARNAVAFEAPEGKPLMSIVLIDDGDSPVGLEALKNFPFPISIAIDARQADATDLAKRYRDAGFEVLAMAGLPENADARDAEVAMQAHLDAVPGAVAVLEGGETGLQASRAASKQLAPILLDTGHGLVMRPNGLDTARKLIAREGVPARTIFRDFDGEGQTARVIRRFLDQAAFKAGQVEDGVIMLGRLRAETISALLLWGLQDRATRVALAPVSAVLRAGE